MDKIKSYKNILLNPTSTIKEAIIKIDMGLRK